MVMNFWFTWKTGNFVSERLLALRILRGPHCPWVWKRIFS